MPSPTSPSNARTLLALVAFAADTLPAARVQARRWAARVDAIPSQTLRGHAAHALRVEHVNVISTAALALLAPREHRRAMIELLMAWRVICSFVDELGEQPSGDPLGNGLQLHRALLDAVSPTQPRLGDYYALHTDNRDGGYLDALVSVCRERLRTLPADPERERVTRLGALRCAEAQSHMHTAAQTGSTRALERWAMEQLVDGEWEWWEIVAASIADLPIMAALATGGRAPAQAYAAQWPGALLASLLDSIMDLEDDEETGDYSLISNYGSDAEVRDRVASIAGEARTAAHAVPNGHIHSAIVAGIVAHYACLPGERNARTTALLASAHDAMRPTITPILMTVRIYRALARDN